MEVYIEYVILDNVIINLILFFIVSKMMNMRLYKWRVVVANIFGTSASIVMPFVQLPTLPLFLVKLLIGAMIMILLCKYEKTSQFVLSYLVFITATFVLGGVCFGIMYLLCADVTFSGLLIYNFEVPISVILVLIIFYFWIIVSLINTFRHKKNVYNFTYDITIVKGKSKIYCKGFLDSGNMLVDKDGNPLVLISQKMFQRIYKDISYTKLVLTTISEFDIPNSYYLEVDNVVSKSKVLVVKLDELHISLGNSIHIDKDVSVGVALTNFKGEFDCLLNNQIVRYINI